MADFGKSGVSFSRFCRSEMTRNYMEFCPIGQLSGQIFFRSLKASQRKGSQNFDYGHFHHFGQISVLRKPVFFLLLGVTV